ncbi:lysylphosphatidylglycerol synthase transmembrane domain-containing protein [Lysobacter claricitrinus]|uniref:lysylphosphatidylglycerol synthase transmembrane domain-containing protein n=1 Tax=Lysobacter claricitrinus TaxID=3367728 RepID=UPI0037DB9FD7
MSSPSPHRAQAPRWRRVVIALGKLALSAGLVVALAWWADWRAVGATVRGANRALLAAAFLVVLPTVPLSAWRWSRCARASGMELPLGFFMRATYAGTFAGQFLPAGVGTDAVRLGFVLHRQARLGAALQSLLLDRLVGVLTVVAVMAAGLPHIWSLLPHVLRLFAVALIIGAVGGLGCMWGLRHLNWLRDLAGHGKRRKLIELVFAVRGSLLSRHVLIAFVVSAAIYLSGNGAVTLIAEALGMRVSYVDVLAVVSMAVFASMLPISVNGWGVREGAMVLGLSVLGVPKATALAISILFGFGSALATLPGAFTWLVGRYQVADGTSLQDL